MEEEVWKNGTARRQAKPSRITPYPADELVEIESASYWIITDPQ
jgi:hypothetical protein